MPVPPPHAAMFAAHRMRALGFREATSTTSGQAVSRLGAMQAQEHPVARWSVAQRMGGTVRGAEVDAAFDRGDVVRTHVLRPTWHYVAAGDLRWLMRFSGPRVYARTARYFRQFDLDPGILAKTTEVIAAAVQAGPRTRRDLGSALAGHGWVVDGPRLAAMVMHAELHMAVCSGPMRAKEHTYVAFDDRARGDGPEGDEALAMLAGRYFATRGPATASDFAWWAGLRVSEARHGLALVADQLEISDVEGRSYAWSGDVAHPTEDHVDFIQCYDEAIVSYSQSRDLLKTADVAFDTPKRMDGFSHVILRNGQLLGHWRFMRGTRTIETRVAGRPQAAISEEVAAGADQAQRFFAERRASARGGAI